MKVSTENDNSFGDEKNYDKQIKMAKRKSTKGQTTIYKTKVRVTQTPLKTNFFLFYLLEFFMDEQNL
jgi:hypothetical protein